MQNHRTFGRAIPALFAAVMTSVAGAALAQSPPAGQTAPQPGTQSDTRDLLGRARSTNEGQMVEDLIKRLQGPGQGGAPAQAVPPQTVGPTPTSPAAPVTPGTEAPSRVATPPAGTPPAPQPVAGPTSVPGVAPTPAPAAQPAAAPQPAAPPTQQAQPRRLPRPAAPPTAAAPDAPSAPAPTAAAPATGAPLQAPLPDSIAAPTPTATEPPAATAPGQRRPPSRRAATQPVGGPPASAGPGEPVPLPMTAAQIERMDALPNIDVEVLFFIDSAQLTNRAFATLAILGRALADERLGGQVFLIAGHTDATGPPDYNLTLSERRAQAVRDFLIMNFGIAEDRLLARGFGPSRLKVPQHPGSRLNRRVQVVNWTSEADANAAPPPQAAPSPPPPRRR
jgi:outer membrane protein OmpA-like peptidoglycan-associated protein